MDEQNTTPEFITQKLKEYNVADAEIAKLADKFLPLTINGLDDTDGYDLVKTSAKHMMTLRTTVEKKRQELKADFLNGGRMVDGEAKRIQELIAPIEGHLVAERNKIDKEKAEKEMAEKLKGLLPMRLEKLATIELVVPEEELNQMDEPKFFVFFNEKQAAYLAAQEEKQAAAGRKLQEERDALEAEKKAMAEDKQRAADIKAAEDRAAQAERDRIAQEERDAKAATAAAAAKAEAAAAAAPDMEKLKAFAFDIINMERPVMKGQQANGIMAYAIDRLKETHQYILQGIETKF